jgi:steroid delta-isomerase-like uncharacterized protein
MKKLFYVLALAAIAASCNMPNNGGNMNSKAEANKAKTQQFYDQVFNGHNLAVIDSFCSPDFTDHNPDQGHSGKGIEDLRAQLKSFFESFPDIHVTTNFMIAQGDTVVAYLTMAGTNSGAMGGMPATNKQVTMDGIDIIAIKDGKAIERWGFSDNMKMMQQMGMMPAAVTGGAPADSAMAKAEEKK